MSRDIQIINAKDIDLRSREVVTVRPSTGYHLIWYIIFSLIFWFALACFAGHFLHDVVSLPSATPQFLREFYANLEDGATPYVSGFATLFLLIFVRMAGSMFRKSLKSESWLIKGTSDGLYIQFRSYLNQHFDADDDTVIFIPAEKISWLREARLTRVTKSRDEQKYEFLKAIEIQIRRMETDAIREAVLKEANRKHAGWRWEDRPVEVQDNILRVYFSNMRPKPAAFIQLMRRWYMTQDMKKLEPQEIDKASWNDVTDDHGYNEADITDAIRAGNTIEAVKIARLIHGMGLKEAKDYVDGLKA